jgi:hypothetical protein
MKKLKLYLEFLTTVTLLTPFFYLLPKIAVFVYRPEATLSLDKASYIEGISKAVLLAIVVSLIITYRKKNEKSKSS